MCYKHDIKESTTPLVMYCNKLDIITVSSDMSHNYRNIHGNFTKMLNLSKELHQNKVFTRSLQAFLNILV